LFRTLPKLLKPNGTVVFSLTQPAFNNASTVHVIEETDDEGVVKTVLWGGAASLVKSHWY